MYFPPLASAPNLERSENISWNMSTSRRLGAIHQLSRDRIICHQVYHGVFSIRYEIWNEFETFTQVYEALLLPVQTEVICSKRKISAIILVLDIAATMVGGTRIYWGDQKRLHWSKFTWFLGFLLSGVSKTGARTTIWYKTDNLGSFKEMTNVHQGWKEKGEVVTFWEGRKWRGNGDRPSDFHRMKTGVDSTIEPRFLGTYLTEKLFPHYTCHASATAQSN